jgi:hypothetical protein
LEELMFDKSFTRSKDYFLVLQLLRIIDDWVDETVLSFDDVQESPAMRHAIFRMDLTKKNFDAATKSMKFRAEKIQTRIRKKTEEIKSLRDGVCSPRMVLT